MFEKEAKIAQVSTEGGTDLLLKWIILTVFLPKIKKKIKNQLLEMVKQNVP